MRTRLRCRRGVSGLDSILHGRGGGERDDGCGRARAVVRPVARGAAGGVGFAPVLRRPEMAAVVASVIIEGRPEARELTCTSLPSRLGTADEC